MTPPDEHGAPYEPEDTTHYPNGPERRSPHWFDKWVNPTTVIALIGGIIWGVQLNMAVVQLSESMGSVRDRLEYHQQMLVELSKTNVQMATILERLEEQVKENGDNHEEHLKDAEVWKQRILENQIRNRGYRIPDDGGIP